ncbi:phage protein NinX family protein [Comamonas sediminis]|uniref:phage protein NinX family protein n=1 Tax=Comamonas sediminis TaxID=1783360 RepID=UPI003D2BFE9D
MTTTTNKTADLVGAALDYAVAMAGAWKHAHEHFPTMTLDSTFKGYRVFRFEGGRVVCQLVPNNPFRQDYVIYEPSSSWELAGPIIDRENIGISPPTSRVHRNGGPHAGWGASGYWSATTWHAGANGRRSIAHHETSSLIAAMRCYVMSKLGETIEVPQELMS